MLAKVSIQAAKMAVPRASWTLAFAGVTTVREGDDGSPG
jgi:hypothetical protein